MIAACGFRKNSACCGREIMKAVRLNWELVLLAVVFLAGMVVGSIYARNADAEALERLDFLFAGNFKARITSSFLSIFAASFASAFLFLFACFLCGLSLWGMLLIPFIPFFRGFGLGLTSGYLYAAYSGYGVLFNLIVILPGAFFCCLSVLLAAREGIGFSRLLAAGGSKAINRSKIKMYTLHFGAVLAIAFFSALIDLLFSACFGGLFSF
jgi:stage II sporulation protein M